MIEFKNVSAAYDTEVPVLNDVSFTINNGDFVAFVGTNGAGKSTTMRLCNGLLKPTAGEVLIDGVPTTELKTSQIARKIGFLFQNPDRQICCKTVREELLFGFQALGESGPVAEKKVDRIIGLFGFDPNAEPYLLNRGTRQLLALASIVVLETPVIILDEPTTGLDYRECVQVMEVVRALHERGTTVIMVCHDMEVVADFAERVIVMTRGRMVAQGATFDVLRDPGILEEADLVAPQIVDISMRLCDDSAIATSDIARANTVEEMVAAIEGMSTKGDEAR
jgi:energy-coupling factor transport system ATP-binding protein